MEDYKKPQALDDEKLDQVAGGQTVRPDGCTFSPDGKHHFDNFFEMIDGSLYGKCVYCSRYIAK